MVKNGFTLIEIIVAIAVISILVSISYAGYAAFSQRQKLTSEAQNLKNLLRDVQSRSFNNEIDCSICNCTSPTLSNLEGWYVNFTSRQFYGRCQGKNFTTTSLKLSTDITIASTNSIIQFIGDPPRVSKDNKICMSMSGLANKYYRIDISRSGDISDSGGLISTCVP